MFGFQNNLVTIALSLPLALAGSLTDSLGLGTVLIAMSIVVATAGIKSGDPPKSGLKRGTLTEFSPF